MGSLRSLRRKSDDIEEIYVDSSEYMAEVVENVQCIQQLIDDAEDMLDNSGGIKIPGWIEEMIKEHGIDKVMKGGKD